MTINKIADRFRDIASGKNTDSSDEYYTLYPAFAAAFIELLCRYKAGKEYKVIICPCDGPTSVFHELENKKEWIGNPRIIYSFWPDKDWKDEKETDENGNEVEIDASKVKCKIIFPYENNKEVIDAFLKEMKDKYPELLYEVQIDD